MRIDAGVRTDAGAHADARVASATSAEGVVLPDINPALLEGARVLNAIPVADGSHARTIVKTGESRFKPEAIPMRTPHES